MENWQQFLQNSGLKQDKLRKKAQSDIADYNDALAYLATAKQSLAAETDDDKKAEIQADIDEIEADLPALNDEIIESIKKDIVTLEKRREVAQRSFGATNAAAKEKAQQKQTATPKPAAQAAATPTSEPAPAPKATEQTPAAPENIEVVEEKKSSGGILDWVVGGVVATACIYLGIAYNKDLFPFKKN